MRGLSLADQRTILLAGGVAVGVYTVGMAALVATGTVSGPSSAAFVAGFLVFIAVYLASMSVSGYFE